MTSVREVDWDNPREGGFIFVFRPGPLDRAPHGYLGIARGPDGPAERARLQRDLVVAWPNVSVIDVREVIAHASGGSSRWRRSASASSAPWPWSAA